MNNNTFILPNDLVEVVKTMEASQNVQARTDIESMSSTIINTRVTVLDKKKSLTGRKDHRPILIRHYFTTSGHYIKSEMITTLHLQGCTVYKKSDGSTTGTCYWFNTHHESKTLKFNLMDLNTMDPTLEEFWAEVMQCYDNRDSKVIYDTTRIPVMYLKEEASKKKSFANPLF